METLARDLRFGIRTLIKAPVFTALALITLALGIGANTAIFSVVDNVLLRPLPYKDSARLVTLYGSASDPSWRNPVSPDDFVKWQERNHVFESMAAISNVGWSANLTGAGDPERLEGVQVSADFFSVLRVQPMLGRAFLPEEETPGHNNVVVLSQALWKRVFAADPKILGKTLSINGQSFAVVGVLPGDFQFMPKVEIWSPAVWSSNELPPSHAYYLAPLARLAPGVTLDQARSEMDIIRRGIQKDPEHSAGIGVMPLHIEAVTSVRPVLLILWGAVAFILLIACANVANLTLARASGREQEMAIRLALGAGRWGLMRQMLAESVILGLGGSLLGLLVAMWGTQFLISGLPDSLAALNPQVKAAGLDARVLGFTLAVSVLTSIVFGLAPAIQATRVELNEKLKDTTKGGGRGSHGLRLRKVLVVSEVALALVLLIGSGLMINSFWRLSHVNTGFNPHNVLTMQVSPPQKKYPGGQPRAAFFKDLLERAGAIPGVVSAAGSTYLPLGGNFGTSLRVEGRPEPAPGESYDVDQREITPDYFKTLEIPLVSGRFFDDRDTGSEPLVGIINQTVARQLWAPSEDPLGKRVKDSKDGPWITIVGIVADTKRNSLDENEPTREMYRPYAQNTWPGLALMVRTTSDPSALAPAVAQQVLAIDKDQPVYHISTLDQMISQSVSDRRFTTLLLALFAALALLLAAVGVYGVMSYAVAERTPEIGLRMALGARQGDVVKQVVGQGLKLVVIGVAIGLGAAVPLSSVLTSFLFHVKPADPATFAAITIVLVGVAFVAAYIPARRASRVDPMVALRYE